MGDEDLPTVTMYVDAVELRVLERGMGLVLAEHVGSCEDCYARQQGWKRETCGELLYLKSLDRRTRQRRKAAEGLPSRPKGVSP